VSHEYNLANPCLLILGLFGGSLDLGSSIGLLSVLILIFFRQVERSLDVLLASLAVWSGGISDIVRAAAELGDGTVGAALEFC